MSGARGARPSLTDVALNRQYLPVATSKVGFKGCCPRCGDGNLYQGLLKTADKCNACDLDYSFIDAGDGPASFVIMLLGFLVLGMALMVDSAFSPPWWVHIVLWLPTIAILGIYCLRVIKGMLIAQQYIHKAQQARLND